MNPPPLTVDVYLDPEDFQENALKLVRRVRPNWTGKVDVKLFADGITNKMLGYCQQGDESDMVLIRINGNKTEIFLDRNNEINSFLKLHSVGCAPKLYCVFNNGLCYEYIPGSTVSREEVRNPSVFGLIAREMAKLHRVMDDNIPQKPICFTLCKRFLDLRFSKDSPPGRGLDRYSGPQEDELRRELADLEQRLSNISSPLVYCHNDLLINNIIFNKNKGTVHFIDFEYTGMNFQAFDIGNHFCEFAGVDDMDYSYYPTQALQLRWLREYLKHWKVDSQDVTDSEVEELYAKVNKFALAAHFLWATWALVQAKYSTIDFDYFKYAKDRLAEYFKRKDEFLSL